MDHYLDQARGGSTQHAEDSAANVLAMLQHADGVTVELL